MDKTTLAEQVGDFIKKTLPDGDLDLGEAAATVETFITELEAEEDSDEAEA
jgi:hypothetical protein